MFSGSRIGPTRCAEQVGSRSIVQGWSATKNTLSQPRRAGVAEHAGSSDQYPQRALPNDVTKRGDHRLRG